MTTATFVIIKGKQKLFVNIQHDGHPDGLFSKPLFNALKKSKKPSFYLVLKTLCSKSDAEFPPLLMNDFSSADYCDLQYSINLNKRTWKLSGYKQRKF